MWRQGSRDGGCPRHIGWQAHLTDRVATVANSSEVRHPPCIMPHLCAMVGCGNRGGRDKKSFHRLPAVIKDQCDITLQLSQKRRDTWLSRISRADMKSINLENVRVCSDHFKSGEKCFIWMCMNMVDIWKESLNHICQIVHAAHKNAASLVSVLTHGQSSCHQGPVFQSLSRYLSSVCKMCFVLTFEYHCMVFCYWNNHTHVW